MSEAAAPDPKAIVGGAFSAAAASYDQVIGFFAPFGRALVAAADLDRGADVLDLACGRGACLYPALDSVGPDGSVLGIDLAPGMVEQMADELAATPNAEVRVGDAEALDLPDGSFDAVTGGFMIFFPPNPPAVLAEAHRVLKPGGTLALSIFDGPPGFAWVADIAKELIGPTPTRPGDDFNQAHVLDEALGQAGFGPVDAIEVTERFHFDDAAHVEAWMRSHGGRLMLDQLDDDRLQRCRELIAENLDAHHKVDGGYELVQRARMTVTSRRTSGTAR